MPMTLQQHLALLAFQDQYLGQLHQTKASNAFGMHTISVAEKGNMLGLMRNWISDHEIGKDEPVFVEEFKEFARPLHSRKGKEALERAASEAKASGSNALHAQIRAAAELRAQRANVFDWDKNKQYNAGVATIQKLDEALRKNRHAHAKGEAVTSVAAQDATTLGVSALQACVLDALLHRYKQIRLLFTTGKLVEGSIFLKVLASSQNLYNRGFIMNPMILRANAPSASAINWDIRLNDFFLHAGIMKNAVFVFATSSVEYATFLDPKTQDAAKRAQMIAAPVGSKVPGLGTWNDMNYPVKPGGSEILTLLEYGYDVEPQDPKFYADAKLGFVMAPGQGPGRRKERFLQMHASFTQEKYDRLIAFMQKLAGLGIYH